MADAISLLRALQAMFGGGSAADELAASSAKTAATANDDAVLGPIAKNLQKPTDILDSVAEQGRRDQQANLQRGNSLGWLNSGQRDAMRAIRDPNLRSQQELTATRVARENLLRARGLDPDASYAKIPSEGLTPDEFVSKVQSNKDRMLDRTAGQTQDMTNRRAAGQFGVATGVRSEPDGSYSGLSKVDRLPTQTTGPEPDADEAGGAADADADDALGKLRQTLALYRGAGDMPVGGYQY